MPALHDADQLADFCSGDLLAGGYCSPGERIVLVFGAPMGVSGSTNSVRVHVVG
jgi:pyruvate kinase